VSGDVDLSTIGSLLAEPARCRMLMALADGRALPATTLAREAHVAASTATGHLHRLVDAGWLEVEPHGRYRFYRLHGGEVVELLEVMARMAPVEPVRSLAGDHQRRALRRARTCYRHLAGRLGVELLAAMVDRAWIDGHDGTFRPAEERLSSPVADTIYRVTERGAEQLCAAGLSVHPGQAAPHCVDWSEQRHHLGGSLGGDVAGLLFVRGWIARAPVGRAVTITEAGASGLGALLGMDIQKLL